mgnify:CR=1 FL=1
MQIRRALPASQRAVITLLLYGLTPREMLDEYGVSRTTIYTWFVRGRFTKSEAAVIGRELYVLPDAIERVRKSSERARER